MAEDLNTDICQSGWLIAFVGSIIADINSDYPNYAWWSLVYTLFCILGIIFVVGADAVYTYHVAIAAFLSAGLVFTTSSINSLIYYSDPAKEAAAAGFILLSIDAVRCLILCSEEPQLMLNADHLDVLLWFSAASQPPPDTRLVRFTQRRSCTDKPQQ